MLRAGVQTLVWITKCGVVLQHCTDIQALQAVDVRFSSLAGKIAIFTKSLFHTAESQFAGEIGEGCEELVYS